MERASSILVHVEDSSASGSRCEVGAGESIGRRAGAEAGESSGRRGGAEAGESSGRSGNVVEAGESSGRSGNVVAANEREDVEEQHEEAHADRGYDERERHGDGPGIHDVAERGPRDVRARPHAAHRHHAAHLRARVASHSHSSVTLTLI